MKSDDISMYDDPTTPASVRELLQAGRRANAGYDVERGLAKHLAAIAATAPAAHWAPAVAKSALPAWFGFVAMPLAAVSVAGLLWLYSVDRAPAVPTAPAVGTATAAPPPSEAPAARVPSAAARPAVQASDDGDSRSDDSHPSSAEKRRSGPRANAAHSSARTGRPSFGGRTSNESDLNGVAPVSGDALAIDSKSDDVGSGIRSSATESSTTAKQPKETRVIQKSQSKAAEQREPVEPTTRADEVQPASTEAAAKPAPPVVDEARLEREMQMLAVTQRVLASDPARALRLSEQGEREFSGSMFSAERRQLGLLALVKLGRVDEARRAGRPFLARYPKAPWSERLRRALATGVVE